MKRNRFTEEQIISFLKEHEAGVSVPDLARKHGFAEGAFYTWRSKSWHSDPMRGAKR